MDLFAECKFELSTVNCPLSTKKPSGEPEGLNVFVLNLTVTKLVIQ